MLGNKKSPVGVSRRLFGNKKSLVGVSRRLLGNKKSAIGVTRLLQKRKRRYFPQFVHTRPAAKEFRYIDRLVVIQQGADERVFPLKHFKNKDKLQVDQSIIVKVLERPGEVRFLFEETDEDFFDQGLEDISLNDLKYSPIFKPL